MVVMMVFCYSQIFAQGKWAHRTGNAFRGVLLREYIMHLRNVHVVRNKNMENCKWLGQRNRHGFDSRTFCLPNFRSESFRQFGFWYSSLVQMEYLFPSNGSKKFI